MTKIVYYVNGRMPTTKANGYQSAQMCKSLMKQKGVSLQLLYQNRKKTGDQINESINTAYDLKVDLPSRKIFCIDFVYLVEKLPLLLRVKFLYILCEYLTTFSSLGFIFRFIKSFGADYLYIRSNQVLIGFGLFFPNSFLKKIVFEVHDLNRSYVANTLFFKYLSKVSFVITVTSFLKDQLIIKNIDSEKILVESDCVDPDRFAQDLSISKARKILNITTKDAIVGFIGRFTTTGNEKGIPEIIKSASLVLSQFPKIKFYFVGGNRREISKYELLINSLGLNRNAFVFIENQHVSKIPFYLWSCNVLLMPHPKTHFYTFNVSPLKLFEYMAARRPIVASNLPSIREILVDKKNALLVSPGSHLEISSAIVKLLNNPSLSDRISGYCIKAVRKYTWDLRAARVLCFIQK